MGYRNYCHEIIASVTVSNNLLHEIKQEIGISDFNVGAHRNRADKCLGSIDEP